MNKNPEQAITEIAKNNNLLPLQKRYSKGYPQHHDKKINYITNYINIV
jgi:hypothetical protein